MAQTRNSRSKNIGVIGLGIIGSRVAANLRHEGWNAFVWNRTAKPAPNFLGSPAEVAQMCDIIQLFVADADATMEMIEAMKDALTPEHVILCHGTIGLEGTLEDARRVQKCGAQFLDAPFTGSRLAAEKRQLCYYIGGDEQTFQRVRPALEATSKSIVFIGGIGQAAVVKVATNLISAATAQVLAEALAIVSKAGVQPEKFIEAIENNAMRSGVTDLKLLKMIAADYEPHFSLKHMFKDVQLGIQLAKKFALEIPATSTVGHAMFNAITSGWGELDFAAVAKAYENGTAA